MIIRNGVGSLLAWSATRGGGRKAHRAVRLAPTATAVAPPHSASQHGAHRYKRQHSANQPGSGGRGSGWQTTKGNGRHGTQFIYPWHSRGRNWHRSTRRVASGSSSLFSRRFCINRFNQLPRRLRGSTRLVKAKIGARFKSAIAFCAWVLP